MPADPPNAVVRHWPPPPPCRSSSLPPPPFSLTENSSSEPHPPWTLGTLTAAGGTGPKPATPLFLEVPWRLAAAQLSWKLPGDLGFNLQLENSGLHFWLSET